MNELKCTVEHIAFGIYCLKSFETNIDNCHVQFQKDESIVIIKIRGRKGEHRLWELCHDLLSLIFIYLGSFPEIREITYNGKQNDLSPMIRKFWSEEYYKKVITCLCNISEETINQKCMESYRRLPRLPLYSMQYLMSSTYEHIVANHRITLLLHTIDGFIDDGVGKQSAIEAKNRYVMSNNPGNYFGKVYALCKGYFFKYHRKFNFKILQALHVNQRTFIEVIADTRNWYSHFLPSARKPHKMQKGDDMRIYFDILFYVLRLHLISEIGVAIDDSTVCTYFYAVREWVSAVKSSAKD